MPPTDKRRPTASAGCKGRFAARRQDGHPQLNVDLEVGDNPVASGSPAMTLTTELGRGLLRIGSGHAGPAAFGQKPSFAN